MKKTNNTQAIKRPLAKLVVGLLLLYFSSLTQASVNTLVLVPETQGAAKTIYAQIIAGIRSNKDLHLSVVKLQKDTTTAWLENEIKHQQAQLVIAVGNRSYKLSQQLKTNTLIVAGGISGKPNGIPTLSLTGSAQSTLQHLKQLLPEIKNVSLVYSEAMNGWWYKQALSSAKSLNINVRGYKAGTLKEGVKLYEKLLAEATSNESAIWIPLRGIVPSKTILPLLLEKAWVKNLAIISNNPAHTKLGSLVALYPKYKEMGAQLANFALQHYHQEGPVFITGTDSLRLAINLRTSSHLGLRFNTKDRASFDKIYPENK